MDLFYKEVGSKFRELRKLNNVKTQKVADILGISVATYRNLESGQRLFTLEQLELLGEIYQVDWIDVVNTSMTNISNIVNDSDIEDVRKLVKNLDKQRVQRLEALKTDSIESISKAIKSVIRLHSPIDYLLQNEYSDLFELVTNQLNTRVNQIMRDKHRGHNFIIKL